MQEHLALGDHELRARVQPEPIRGRAEERHELLVFELRGTHDERVVARLVVCLLEVMLERRHRHLPAGDDALEHFVKLRAIEETGVDQTDDGLAAVLLDGDVDQAGRVARDVHFEREPFARRSSMPTQSYAEA